MGLVFITIFSMPQVLEQSLLLFPSQRSPFFSRTSVVLSSAVCLPACLSQRNRFICYWSPRAAAERYHLSSKTLPSLSCARKRRQEIIIAGDGFSFLFWSSSSSFSSIGGGVRSRRLSFLHSLSLSLALSFGMISPFLHPACLPLPPLPLLSPLRRRGRLDEILLAHRSETVEAVKSRRGDPRRQISSSRGRTHDGAYVTHRNRK